MQLIPFNSEEEVIKLIRKIKAQQVSNDAFTHREHLALAAWIAITDDIDPLKEIKDTILALNKANGVEQTKTGGYHETLTVAWFRLISTLVKAQEESVPKHEKINAVLEHFADKYLILTYYTKEHIMSWKARTEWVEPDLRPLGD